MIKLFIFIALLIVLGSLFSALYYLIKDQGRSDRVVNALLLRVIASAVLLGVIILLVYLGVIHPNPRPF